MTTSRACEILGIPEHPFPTADVIQTAFRRKTSLYHPDRNPSPEASEKMKELNTARDYLMRYIK